MARKLADIGPLFTPLTIRSITFKNRIGISPMCQYAAEDGFPNDWHVSHLGARATGGAGIVIVEATGVAPEGRISKHCLGIWKDEQIPAWKRVAAVIKKNGAVPSIQIAHAGRKASSNVAWVDLGRSLTEGEGAWQTIAPSAIPFGGNHSIVPKEATKDDIKNVVAQFREAARRSLEAGFEVIEIHGAHGYLIDEFLSPLSNKRTDEYGGSLDNRARIVEEIITEIRKVWPERFPLFLRLSTTDWVEGGKTIDDTVNLAKKFKKLGVDLIDCSSGFVVPESFRAIKYSPGFQVPFSEKIKKESGILAAAVGAITTGTQANEIIANNQADFVLIGTQSLRDPHFPFNCALELGASPVEAATLLPNQTGFWLQKSRLYPTKTRESKL